MIYKDYKIQIEKTGYFSAFNFKTLQRAGPQKTIKALKVEIDEKEKK